MATTNAALAAEAIDALSAAGIDFAFLHREQEAARGVLSSDYDLAVCATDAASALRHALSAWQPTGLRPVLASEYDAGSVAVWLATPDARDGVQIDFTYDATGAVNQMALPIGSWVETAVQGERWPTVLAEHEQAYRNRKHALKRAGWQAPHTRARLTAEAARLHRRLTSRTGFWVNVERLMVAPQAEQLVERFGRFLPSAVTMELSPHGRASWHRAAPVVYRPGLLVTHSSMARERRADFILDSLEGRDVDAMAESLTAAMAGRLTLRYGNRAA